ncbi:cytokine receptor common subunit gamma-like isoform X2 [Rhinoraja longicauda]
MARQYPLKRCVQPKIVSLIWLIVLSNVPYSMPSDDVDCIFYNEEFMECTWSQSGEMTNYTLYHWYKPEPVQECKSYIQQRDYNVGCNFSAGMTHQFKDFYVFRNGSNGSGDISRGPQMFQLQNQVQPFAPGNLVVNATKNRELLLSWESPMPIVTCLEFEVRYRNNKDKEWQKASVLQQTNFNLPSVDPEKLYTFQVKSKVNKYCGTTKLWSEWSLPVYWGRNDTQTEDSKEVIRTYITVISLAGIIALMFCLIRSERLKVIIIPKIPNPGRNFDPLFNNYNGNFQDWLGVSKDTLEGFKSSYHENVCIVSESPLDVTQSRIHGGFHEQIGRTEMPEKSFSPDTMGEARPKLILPAALFSDIAVFVESSSNTKFG